MEFVVLKISLEVSVDDLLTELVYVQSTEQTTRINTLLQFLEITLNDIKSILNDSMLLSRVLDHWKGDTAKFIRYMEKGKEVILKCSGTKFWNVYQSSVCAIKLIQLDKELLRFFHSELGNNTMDTENVINPIWNISSLDQQLSAFSSTHAPSNYAGSCSVPRLPGNIVGFDGHLEELKHRLLNDANQILVVSAPIGFGKTTLVKMLCHDKNIKDIFGKNILYVTISRQSNLKTVVQKLFEHYGENHPKFQTNEEARNQLEDLMRRHMGSNNMLLVLDLVGSVSVSDNICDDIWDRVCFPIPGYKILVTSRSSSQWDYSTYALKLLNGKDARKLFCKSAFPKDEIYINVPAYTVNQIVESCNGLPLALTVAGASLCGQPLLKWEMTHKRWFSYCSDTYNNALLSLKPSIDALDEFPVLKECFLDISSFLGDIRIAGRTLMDMWAELYNIDNECMFAVDSLLDLSSRKLISLPPIRKEAGELEGCFNELYVTQLDFARQFAIHLGSQKPFEERKRLFIEIRKKQFPTWWIEQTVQPLNTQILSISTDETFDSIWYDLIAPKVEVLTLNIRSQKYALPPFIKKMDQLKVVSIMSHGGFHAGFRFGKCLLQNHAFIRGLSNLKRIRFERILVSPSSIQPIFALQNLTKLSFVACEIGDALMSSTIESPYMLPNLKDLEIDGCYDLKELPEELCNLIHLKKLSITSCDNLKVLPKGLGSLINLERLRLHSCTKLQELPKSIGRLNKLGYIDTSDCEKIRVLPEEIGELSGLRWLKMSGCRRLLKLPTSMSKLHQLKDVICDKETLHLWMAFRSDLYHLNIHIGGISFKSMMKTTNVEDPSIGNMVDVKQSSHIAGTNVIHVQPPSYSDVAPRKGSFASESSYGHILSVEAPSIGNMVHVKQSLHIAGTDFIHVPPPSYGDVAPRKGSLAIESSDGHVLSVEDPSIGNMVHVPPPSYSDVAPRKGSLAIESSDGHILSVKAPSIGRFTSKRVFTPRVLISSMFHHHHTVM